VLLGMDEATRPFCS